MDHPPHSVKLLRYFHTTMQPYFDPTRKTTSKKLEEPQNKNGRRPHLKKQLEWRPQKKGRRSPKKMEDNQSF
jgi:hypothetical protein